MWDEDKNPNTSVRWTSKSKNDISIAGLSGPESDAIEGALKGANWIRVKDGRLQFASAFDKPPEAEFDENVGPFWPRKGFGKKGNRDVKHYKIDDVTFSEPHILIEAVGAGASEKYEEVYEKNRAKLESYGFECLRSRRGVDGKYWEIWYLPSLMLSEGDLGAAIAKGGNGKKYGDPGYMKARLDAAVSFLCRSVNFGSLDVGVQRAALTFD